MNRLEPGVPPSGEKPQARALPAIRWILSGIVQGVGFRPFVYRLARQYRLAGWVRNRVGQVEVVASGAAGDLDRFAHDLLVRAPAIAEPVLQAQAPFSGHIPDNFAILESETDRDSEIHVPADYFVCDDCLSELRDPADRRYRYPFINCTQCGPRYTLITALPYDRPNTSMAGFVLCPDCLKEYNDVADRRFHAEPVACPVCGPQLLFRKDGNEVVGAEHPLRACVEALREGIIVAVKGVGGYHLMCDAGNKRAIQRLRKCKPRPHKPLAVMFPDCDDLELLRNFAALGADQEALLRSPVRPIALVSLKNAGDISGNIAPGLDEVGVMLPYSPLHHLLLDDFGGPLVATSANISGEPVMTGSREVEQRLADVAGAFMHHDRPIARPADDAVYRTIAGKPRPLRLGRGNAPAEFELPVELERPLLATGGHMKNTVCLAWADRAVVSPHIGDMGTARSIEVFEQVVQDLQQLYDVQAEALVCDAHPDYATTRWAQRQSLPLTPVQHHAAHASALIGERYTDPKTDCLVFTWDGVGYGSDRTLWGGEALYGGPGRWQRVASLRPFRLPGGDRASREPWRSAVSLAWESGADQRAHELMARIGSGLDAEDRYALLHRAWQQGLNAPETSAAGRLFDAAAAFTGLCLQADFEGQGPMWLEAVSAARAEPIELPLTTASDGLLRTDWQPLVEHLMDQGCPADERAAVFHATMAGALVRQAVTIRDRYPFRTVGLCGGVFQNRRLTEACLSGLEDNGFRVLLGERLPVNDAGLAFGQVVEFAFLG